MIVLGQYQCEDLISIDKISQRSAMENNILPADYAEKLLELESALEEECNMERIKDLNDHYRIGIDYYISEQPRKAIHLQKKMTNLLSDPDNLRILERSTNTQALSRPPQVRNQKKLKQQIKKFNNVADSFIKNMMENSKKAVGKMEELKRKDLNRQEQHLKERILLKKAKSMEKSKQAPSLENIPPPNY